MKQETFNEVIDQFIQQEADGLLERDLTENELEEVKEAVLGDIWMLIQDKISEMVNYRELLERNKDAEKSSPYYKIIWKNENAYRKNFQPIFSAKTHEDAKKYIRYKDFISEYDQYKIIKVDGATEIEIETVGEGRWI